MGAERFDPKPLLAWYRRTARDLPWRKNKDPWRVWVSEIMLQQTQIETVIPYYERWMAKWPTRAAFAKAALHDVLKMWEGLGYYARARNLHRAAKELTSFPKDAAGWRELPGVGAYTAAAISSISGGEAVAVLDGNVRRVMTRLLGIEGIATAPAATARIEAALARSIPPRAPGDFNQAIMELGQRVCRPKSPDCLFCPLSSRCEARMQGIQDRIPRTTPAAAVPHHDIAIGICWKGGKVLVARRPEKGLLGGLWEFPGGKRKPRETRAQALRREFREETGLDIEVGREFAIVPHRYSHFSVELHVFDCRWKRGKARAIASDEVRWVAPEALRELPFPRANSTIIAKLLERRLAAKAPELSFA